MNADVIVVLQARMGSSRLPGKVMEPIGRRSLLAHCIQRLTAASVGPVVVATTAKAEDDGLAREASACGAAVVRGPDEDVLTRFETAAIVWSSRTVIRATADNPAIDLDAPARVLRALRAGRLDHVVESGLPYGSAVEAVRAKAIRTAGTLATEPADREHVTPYIRRDGTGFRTAVVRAPARVARPDLRFSIDTADDLIYMRAVLALSGADEAPVPLTTIIRAADALVGNVEVA